MQWRNWDIGFGPAFGLAGSQVVLAIPMQVAFRGEKVMASDTASQPGTGTRIMQCLVGQKMQRPTANGSTSSLFFAPYALGNGLRWDTCQPGLTISITVSFVVSCTFDMSVFGQALV